MTNTLQNIERERRKSFLAIKKAEILKSYEDLEQEK